MHSVTFLAPVLDEKVILNVKDPVTPFSSPCLRPSLYSLELHSSQVFQTEAMLSNEGARHNPRP